MARKEFLSRRKFLSNTAVFGAAGTFVTKDFLGFFSGNKDKSVNKIDPGSLHSPYLEAEDNFWYIPATHWEGAVFKTREEYLDMGLPNILTALKLLNEYPDYRFTLDQVCYVKPFLERYPEEAESFRQFVMEGRLQIVGATDTMHDANIPAGESIVHQMLYGKNYFREKLGVDVTVGWGLDTFGHNAQMPQILRLAGYKSYWFSRGVPNREVPSECLWEGIDGSKIPAFYLPKGYCLLCDTPDNIDEFTDWVKQRFESLAPWSYRNDRVGLDSMDVGEPSESVPIMVKAFENRNDKPFNLRLAVPADYEEVVNKRTDRQVLKGELNPIFQGTYSSRIDLKQRLRNVERLLITAEKLRVLGTLSGKSFSEEKVMSAWEPAMFNQAHDLMAGVMTDHVYEDTLRGYDFSTRLGKEMVDECLDYLSSQVDTSGEGIPLVVFNPLGWNRDDVVETVIGFKKGGIVDLQVTDPSNQVIPVEILEAERFHDGGIKNAKIIFIARNVPGLGHAVYRVIPLASSSDKNTGRENSDGLMENEFYRVKVDLSTGSLTCLELKSNNWQVFDRPGNVIVHQYDGGDLWELYENLNGGSNIGITRKQPVPLENIDQFSTEYSGKHNKAHQGPVYSEYVLAPHSFCADGEMSTTIRIYQGLHRIEIHTKILNNEKYVRYQVLFPTTIKDGKIIHEIPFGSVERPNGVEFPAQNWADYSDTEKGLALLNRGLPGNLTSDSTMMLSLMRSARIASYGYQGGYERGMISDSGLMMDREFEFDYALVPHTGDWQQGEVYRHGLEYNNPLLCRKSDIHKGRFTKTWGLLEVSEPNVVISALKQSRDGSIVLRLYEASGNATPGVIIKSRAGINSAYEANLIEDTGREIKVTGDTLKIDMRSFEIKTLKLRCRNIIRNS
jgi:alpha-mannosidase